MHEKKVVIVVDGGAVRTVLGNGDLSGISIEVMDLDRPAFETPEETAAFDALDARFDEMMASEDWEVLY